MVVDAGLFGHYSPRLASRKSPVPPSAAIAALVVVLAGAAAATAVMFVRGAPTVQVISPIALLAGIAFVALSCYRFEWFVLGVLAIRTLADVTKARPSGNQIASVVSTAPSSVSSGPAASALAVLFIVISTVWLFANRRDPSIRRITIADAAFAFFVTSCLLSVLTAASRTAAVTEAMRIVAAVLMFVVLQRLLTSMQRIRRTLIACAAAFVAPVALAGLQVLGTGGQFQTNGISRVVGSFLHPNTFGLFLAMFILMAVALFRHCPPRTQWALAGAIAINVGLLALTYSRGAWLALFVGLVLIAAVQSRQIFLWMIGVAVCAAIAVPSVVTRLSTVTSANATSGSTDSLFWRFKYWAEIWQLNHNNPVTGIGLHGTKFLTDQSKAPHNDFLRAYVETGLLGLLAYVVVIISLVAIARRALRVTSDGLSRGVAVGFAGVLAAYLVDSFGDNLMSEVVVLWYFYAAAACALAVSRLALRPQESASAGWSGEAPTAALV